MEINGVASLLNDGDAHQVAQYWRLIEERYGLKGKNTDLPPHFTWQVVERYDLAQFEPLVRALAWAAQPFTVRVSGLGIFSGRSPVLYLPIIKDANLIHLHEQIWRYSQCCATRASLYYSPSYWMPHITLFSGEADRQSFSSAANALAYEPFDWEIEVDNLSLIRPKDTAEPFELLRMPFGRASHAE